MLKKYSLYYSLFVLQGIFFMSYSPSRAQTTITVSSILESTLSEQQKIHKLDSLFLIWEQRHIDSLNQQYQDYAYWLYDQGKKEKAIYFEEKALSITLASQKTDTLFAQKSALYLGFYYRMNGQFQQSLKSYYKTVNLGGENDFVDSALNQLALIYAQIKDHDRAHLYYNLSIDKLQNKKATRLLTEAYFRAAYNSIQLNDSSSFSRSVFYAKKADSLSYTFEASKELHYDIKICLGNLYNTYETLNIPIADRYYHQALDLAKALNDSYKIREAYMNLGNLYQTTDMDIALNYGKKAMAFVKKDSLSRLKILGNMGFAYSYFGKYKEAIPYMLDALFQITEIDFKEHTNEYTSIFLDSPYKKELLIQFSILGETYLQYYEETRDKKLLEKSITYFTRADQVIDLLKVNSDEFNSRLFWRDEAAGIYSKAIRACYLNNDIAKAYYFIEKNKALLLMEDLAQQKYKETLALSNTILQQEQDLQKAIIRKEQALLHKRDQEGPSTLQLSKALIQEKRKLDVLRDSIYSKNRLRFDPTIRSLQETQKDLKHNEVIVNYHISRDDGYGIYTNNGKGYIVVLTKEDEYFFEMTDTNTLEKDVQSLLESIRKPLKTTQDIKSYAEGSYGIYECLFPSHEIKSLIKGKKLIIAADDYLAFLPFEALSTTSDKIHYLIHDTEISYVYSNSFVKNIQQETTQDEVSFLGVAPVHFKDQQLDPLENSIREINSLKTNYSGTALIDQESLKTSFLKELEQRYSIIHLATHSNAQDSISPWIALQDDKITLEELYVTKNNASLVFLSGCNTTIGKHETGEGVMSLARGFFYSGAQSVISTLWSIDDRATAQITDSFYDNLSKGHTKSKALHLAKLNYLEKNSLSDASPYYWASPILLGQNDRISTSSNSGILIIILLTSLVVIVFFLLRYKRKKVRLSLPV